MNSPEVNTLLGVSDLFSRLVQLVKGEVIRELMNNGIVGNLQSRVNDIERSLDPTALATPLTARQVKEIVEDALENYDPTDHTDFDDAVKEILIEEEKNIDSKIKRFIEDNVRVAVD